MNEQLGICIIRKQLSILKACIAMFMVCLQVGCGAEYPLTSSPNMMLFDSTVASPALRDSLREDKLAAGMPYFVVTQIFDRWPSSRKHTKVPVASIGSRQRLWEVEGWAREFVDPNIQVFFDEYKTKKGKLVVWYQKPDFYRMDVKMGDTLYIFWDDTVAYSVIDHLKKSRTITVEDKFPQIPRSDTLYGEIHHYDHSWRDVSYWFALRILGDAQTFSLRSISYELYPIEFIELDGEKADSYQWR